ncbi:MAG: pyridoxal phosphate-dependent aminotransferase, partial [Limisphaerales bacterium]
RLLQEEKVACVPGSAFGPSGEGYLRCCFATALDRIEEAVERIARLTRRLGTTAPATEHTVGAIR